MERVELILGTMMLGARADAEESRKMLTQFSTEGWTKLDTAAVYNDGVSEQIIGEWLTRSPSSEVSIATKVHPRTTGRLDGPSVRKVFESSLKRLQVEKVDLLYLHAPDLLHPVEDALRMCAELYQEGRFRRLGLSNYPAWLVEKAYYLCERNDWPRPQVYQGMYNAITRAVEPELLPALRDLGMQFYVYNPLAGGLLAGKYNNFNKKPEAGRFASMPHYIDRFWKESAFKALEQLKEVCVEHKISMAHAALRWLLHHSELSAEAGDGVILGASTIDQLADNMNGAEAGPLPDAIVAAFQAAWDTARCECPDYFRFYS
ncbi:MAG TPA: aldo/keto reductase [Halalkalibaculum sp.]|nr:aldo/keto reductase [Halalkalibaculum sp.]